MTETYSQPFASQLTGKAYVVAEYLVSGVKPEEIKGKAEGFATGQSIGTWLPLPGITKKLIQTHKALVLGFELVNPNSTSPEHKLWVAFPEANFDNSFAGLLTSLVGNDVSTSIQIRLQELYFSEATLKNYPGPKKGIEGIRKLVEVYDRPLLLNMLKPSIGLSPKKAGVLFYESVKGGVDIIKDDEVLSEVKNSNPAERTRAFTPIIERIFQEEGRRVFYIPSITGTPSMMRKRANEVLEAGGKAVMVNHVMTGLDSFAELADEFGNDLVIMGHYAGVGVMQSEHAGISLPIMVGTLPRLAGADMVMTMYSGELGTLEYQQFIHTVKNQRKPLGEKKVMMATVGGGLTPLNIGKIIQTLGIDLILGIGGAIQGHPQGTRSGAEAARAAIDAAIMGIELSEMAKNCEPLSVAIDAWS